MLPGDRGFIPNRSDRAKVTGIRSLRARACVTTLLRPFRTSGDSAGRTPKGRRSAR